MLEIAVGVVTVDAKDAQNVGEVWILFLKAGDADAQDITLDSYVEITAEDAGVVPNSDGGYRQPSRMQSYLPFHTPLTFLK